MSLSTLSTAEAFAAAERTPWLANQRVRRYNPTLALLALLVPVGSAVPVVLADPDRLWPIAMLLALCTLLGLVLLGRRAMRGIRLNNGAVALMTRGEELGASGAFTVAIRGLFGRDIVSMSLHNLGVLALRSLDLPSSVALFRAALAASGGFRFRWQPNLAAELSHAQLAFALAASGAEGSPKPEGHTDGLEEAAAELEACTKVTSPLAIAFAVRARAMLAARRAKFDEAIDVLDSDRALLRNVLPLNDAVLCEAMTSYALSRLGNSYRGAGRASQPVLADDLARAYVRRMLPEAEAVLVSA